MPNIEILPILWAGIIGFCIVMYVILDGFTLGIGILMPWMSKQEKSIAQSVILPTWDGNQTWLVLGGASLYGAFPLAFAAVLPLFYGPIILMIISLLLRGVVFEFRLKTKDPKRWDIIFSMASLLIIICQGYMLSRFILGVNPPQQHFTISYIVTCILGILLGYALLGSTRLVLKTVGELRDKMYFYSKILSWCVVLVLAGISWLTPMINSFVNHRWFAQGNWVYLIILPYLSGICFVGMQMALYKKVDRMPFYLTIGIFVCGYLGLVISIFPYIIPYAKTIWQCASPDSSLKFMLFAAVIMIPILLIYTGYAYYIFKDKVTDVISY
jgi:cytochrome d ubiquinol oxidase subunit II